MKNWLKSGAGELAGELATATLIIIISGLLRGMDLIIRALTGPQFAAIVWILLMLIALVAITFYLIRQANRPA